MMAQVFLRVLVHVGIASLIGIIGGLVWAVVFWNSDLFIWHWASVPLSMVYVAVAVYRVLFKKGRL